MGPPYNEGWVDCEQQFSLRPEKCMSSPRICNTSIFLTGFHKSFKQRQVALSINDTAYEAQLWSSSLAQLPGETVHFLRSGLLWTRVPRSKLVEIPREVIKNRSTLGSRDHGWLMCRRDYASSIEVPKYALSMLVQPWLKTQVLGIAVTSETLWLLRWHMIILKIWSGLSQPIVGNNQVRLQWQLLVPIHSTTFLLVHFDLKIYVSSCSS